MKLRADAARTELSPERQGETTIALTPETHMSSELTTRFDRKRSVHTTSPVRVEDIEHPTLLPDVKKRCQPAPHVFFPAFNKEKNAHSPEIIESRFRTVDTSEANLLELDQYWNTLFQNQQKMYEQMLAGANAATNTANLLNACLAEKLAEQESTMTKLKTQFNTTNEEFGQLKCIMGNTAHDFKSPLNTMILGKTNRPVFSAVREHSTAHMHDSSS